MTEGPDRVRLEEIDWQAALPVTHIFSCFRMAIHPSKILLALAMIVLLYLCGTLMDVMSSTPVYRGERDHYEAIVEYESKSRNRSEAPPSLDEWRVEQSRSNEYELKLILGGRDRTQLPNRTLSLSVDPEQIASIVEGSSPYSRAIDEINAAFKNRGKAIEDRDTDEAAATVAALNHDRRVLIYQVRQLQPKGVFAAVVAFKLSCFHELVRAAASFNLGVGELLPHPGTPPDPLAVVSSPPTVVGSLKKLIIKLPCWMWAFHPWFLVVFGIVSFVLWSWLGGGLARLAALHATRDDRATTGSAVGFGGTRFFWFFLAPLMPIIISILIVACMAAVGFVLFNVEVLEWLGGLLFILALGASLAVTLLLIGLLAGCNLLYPAIAVEGTDAFDAISRSYNYVLGRPWRMIFYNVSALIYGAISYTFLSIVVYLTLLVTHNAAGALVVRSKYGVNRFDAMMPKPVFGSLLQDVDWYALNWSAKVAAVMVHVWTWLAVAFLAAFAISFYLCASTWVYLLLRRAADGTEFDDVFVANAQSEPDFLAPQPPLQEAGSEAESDPAAPDAADSQGAADADDDRTGGASPPASDA